MNRRLPSKLGCGRLKSHGATSFLEQAKAFSQPFRISISNVVSMGFRSTVPLLLCQHTLDHALRFSAGLVEVNPLEVDWGNFCGLGKELGLQSCKSSVVARHFVSRVGFARGVLLCAEQDKDLPGSF
eukprot:s2029_g18.t1